MTTYRGAPATQAEFELAEGILWDDRAQCVRWVDILKGRVLAGDLRGGQIATIDEIDIGQTAGAVALAEDGGLLVAATRGLATVSQAGKLSFGPDLREERPDVRFNDGAADRFGGFVVGTLSNGEDAGEELLLRVFPNGRLETLREGVRLSNGVAFSPDGGTIYHVDTLAGTVSRHSYGSGPFDRSEPWSTVLDDFPYYPDGLTVDSKGALWVAQWGGSGVCRYAPTGELLDSIVVDAMHASCPGFVGPGLKILAVTTAQYGLDTFTDMSGAIFISEVAVPGLPAYRWAGSTTDPYWLKS